MKFKRRKYKKTLTLILFSLLISLVLFFTSLKTTSSEDMEEVTPTLFIHGYKGGPHSFLTMIDRFEEERAGTKQMVIIVKNNGKLRIIGDLNAQQTPLIQVVFSNDRASLEKQTYWLKKIMHTLKEKYDVKHVNFIGHSMGGLAATNFLLQNQSHPYPDVKKMVVIASPFQGISRENYFKTNRDEAAMDLRPNSRTLQQLTENKDFFDDHVEVLAIAGVINENDSPTDHWDGLVDLNSVRQMKEIVPDRNYQEKVVYGHYATHSGLHEHPEVDQSILQFLE